MAIQQIRIQRTANRSFEFKLSPKTRSQFSCASCLGVLVGIPIKCSHCHSIASNTFRGCSATLRMLQMRILNHHPAERSSSFLHFLCCTPPLPLSIILHGCDTIIGISEMQRNFLMDFLPMQRMARM